ncbi:MAG: hypothetical protein Q8O94_02915 [bacterium]|nr:hypothetical protein [bacterium]
MMSTPVLFTFVATGDDLGAAYNQCMKIIGDDDAAVFIDHDALFTTADWMHRVHRLIKQFPDVVFVPQTNRIGCQYLVNEDAPKSDDYREHRQFGSKIAQAHKKEIVDVTDRTDYLIGGVVMILSKKTWKKVGGFKEGLGFLGIDNALHRACVNHGIRILQAQELYVYHWYRGGNQSDKSHLVKASISSTPLPTKATTRTDIINYLIARYSYRSYLEIGVQTGVNLKQIRCEKKASVDPDRSAAADFVQTSDSFFQQNRDTFDCIFIDGLHIKEQCARDIANAILCLNENGSIVIHDCLPKNEGEQTVPRIQSEWTGDVWKAVLKASRLPGWRLFIVDTDCGVGVLRRGTSERIYEDDRDPFTLNFAEFQAKKKDWLHIVSPDSWTKHLDEVGVAKSAGIPYQWTNTEAGHVDTYRPTAKPTAAAQARTPETSRYSSLTPEQTKIRLCQLWQTTYGSRFSNPQSTHAMGTYHNFIQTELLRLHPELDLKFNIAHFLEYEWETYMKRSRGG